MVSISDFGFRKWRKNGRWGGEAMRRWGDEEILLIACLLTSVLSCRSFTVHCAAGIAANAERVRDHLDASLMLATCLSPHLGL
jgi:hypothetical protein